MSLFHSNSTQGTNQETTQGVESYISNNSIKIHYPLQDSKQATREGFATWVALVGLALCRPAPRLNNIMTTSSHSSMNLTAPFSTKGRNPSTTKRSSRGHRHPHCNRRWDSESNNKKSWINLTLWQVRGLVDPQHMIQWNKTSAF